MGDKQNNSFWSPKARAPRFGEESKGEEEEKEKGGGEEENQGMFVLESSVFGFLRFGMKISFLLWSRFCEKIT